MTGFFVSLGSKEVPSTTPVSRAITNSAGNKRVRLSESEMSTRRSIPSTPPLPPISGQDATDQGQFKGEIIFSC